MDNYGHLWTITGPYRRFVIPRNKDPIQTRALTDKGPLQTRDPYMIYMQSRKGLLQTRGPYKHYIQAKIPIQVCKEPLKTRNRGPHRKWPLQTRRPYRQRVLTYK